MGNTPWLLLNLFGTIVKLTFCFGGIALFTLRARGVDAPSVLRWIFRWAKRLFPVVAPLYWLSEAIVDGPLNGWDALFIVLDWWNYRNLKGEDDDDAWKRMKERVTEVVKQVGTRLVVAPATSSA